MTVYSVTKARSLGKAPPVPKGYAPPPGTGPNSPSFFWAMAIMNVISVGTLGLWGCGTMDPLGAFALECWGFAVKW